MLNMRWRTLHLKSRFALTIASGLSLVLYSQSLGQADFGFRVEKIDVKLSQKFPPAIAHELLEQEVSSTNSPNTPDQDVIQLSVGFPDLGPVQLEELSFGVLEELHKKTIVNPTTPRQPTFNIEDADFSEEEKTRLRLAKLEKGLEIEDLLPRHEVSFSERAQELIRQEQGRQQTERNTESALAQNPVTSKIKDPSSRTVVIHQELKGPTVVQGEIEFVRDGSLAMTDQHFIDVRRFEEGVAKEIAEVDLSSGTFTLNLKATKGVIVGRLTNQRGGVEGEGVLAVSDLINAKSKKLVLKKLATRELTRVSSAYGKGGLENQPPPGLRLAGHNPQGQSSNFDYQINAFDSSSEVVAEASAKNHHSTISMVNLLSGAELVMLPERMVNGLIEILSEQDIQLDLDRGDSLIWGTVHFNGRPVEGATVVASQGRISYFGGLYLPDQTRSKTSENGMFAVAVHQPGWNDLYIELPDGKGVHINALVYPGKVTQVVADIPSETIPVTLRSFDAFSGDPVRARLEIQQLSDIVDTGEQGAMVVELPKTRNFSFITANAEAPYEAVRIAYSQFLDYLHIPMFTKSWLDELRGQVKINDNLQTGNIVGFVQGDDFIVEVPNKETLSKIVYFDQRGRGLDHGVAGGGFVIFNLEEETPNIIIVSRRTEKEIGRVIRPDRQFIQVLNAVFE